MLEHRKSGQNINPLFTVQGFAQVTRPEGVCYVGTPIISNNLIRVNSNEFDGGGDRRGQVYWATAKVNVDSRDA